jgi:hypothetical protein
MFKGYSICSHVVAVAEVNGDLPVLLKGVQKGCKPNLSAIANQGLPCGSGRKGGVPKRKRKGTTPIESRSVRQCFQLPTDGDILSQLPGRLRVIHPLTLLLHQRLRLWLMMLPLTHSWL